jgi:hypothetical protein
MNAIERYLSLDDLFPGAGLAMASLPYEEEGEEDPEEDDDETKHT